MTSRCVFKTPIALGLLSLLNGRISCFTWVFQKLLACAYGRTPLCSFARSPRQSSSGYHSPPSSGQRLRPCLDPLWQAELQELERIRVNWVRNHVTLTHLEFAFYNRKRALTLLFGIFILLATLFLAFVPTLCLNHWLHSFLRFPRLLKGPHASRASSFTALLRHTFGKQLIYVNIGNNKKKKTVRDASFTFSKLIKQTYNKTIKSHSFLIIFLMWHVKRIFKNILKHILAIIKTDLIFIAAKIKFELALCSQHKAKEFKYLWGMERQSASWADRLVQPQQ